MIFDKHLNPCKHHHFKIKKYFHHVGKFIGIVINVFCCGHIIYCLFHCAKTPMTKATYRRSVCLSIWFQRVQSPSWWEISNSKLEEETNWEQLQSLKHQTHPPSNFFPPTIAHLISFLQMTETVRWAFSFKPQQHL